MLRLNSLMMMAAAALWISGSCQAQNCQSCSSDFGYPTGVSQYGGCGDCGSGNSGNHPKLDQMKALNNKVCARNDAWPKPFNCADRQLYFTMWQPMIDRGFEEQCVLISAHFDPETHELNRFGQTTVAGIMQNMPTSRKKVFVNRDIDSNISQARLNSVQKMVGTYYGQIAPGRRSHSRIWCPPRSKVTGLRRLTSCLSRVPRRRSFRFPAAATRSRTPCNNNQRPRQIRRMS